MSTITTGVAEVQYRGKVLGRCRFTLSEEPRPRIPAGHFGDPHATIPGLGEPPSGTIEPVDGLDLGEVSSYPEVTLHANEQRLRCMISYNGQVSGLSGWSPDKG